MEYKDQDDEKGQKCLNDGVKSAILEEAVDENVLYVHNIYNQLETAELNILLEKMKEFKDIIRTDSPEILKAIQELDFLPLLYKIISENTNTQLLIYAVDSFNVYTIRWGIENEDNFIQIFYQIFQYLVPDKVESSPLILYILTAISICITEENYEILDPEFYLALKEIYLINEVYSQGVANFCFQYLSTINLIQYPIAAELALFIISKPNELNVEMITKIFHVLLKQGFLSFEIEGIPEIFDNLFSFQNKKSLKVLFTILSEMNEKDFPHIKSGFIREVVKTIIFVNETIEKFSNLQHLVIESLVRMIQIVPLTFRDMFLTDEDTDFIHLLVSALINAKTILKSSIAKLFGLVFDRFPNYFESAIIEGDEEIISGLTSVIELEDDSTVMIVNGVVALMNKSDEIYDALNEHGVMEEIVNMYESTDNETVQQAIESIIDKFEEKE